VTWRPPTLLSDLQSSWRWWISSWEEFGSKLTYVEIESQWSAPVAQGQHTPPMRRGGGCSSPRARPDHLLREAGRSAVGVVGPVRERHLGAPFARDSPHLLIA
jgi:hypothetical protein